MVLSGEMKLEHKERYSKVLGEFEQDSFMGEWETISYGKVIDFNLMTNGPYIGKLEHIRVAANSSVKLVVSSEKCNKVFKAFYPINQSMKLFLGKEEIEVTEKNLIIIEQNKNDEDITMIIPNKNEVLNIIMAEVFI